MVCYVVPAATAIGVHLIRKKKELGANAHLYWLNLLFYGASVFGFVDHLWNGELFLVGANIVSDMILGLTITASVLVFWGFLVYADRMKEVKPATA